MLNRKGFSLIEMIICIAMIGILTAGAIGLSGHIRMANVERCAKELNSYMEKARLATMSKSGSPFVYVYKTNDGVFYKFTDETTLSKTGGTKIGGGSIKVYFTIKNGTNTEEELTTENEIKFQFTKDTGAFTSINGGNVYDNIRIASSGSISYTIKMAEKTGRHYIE